jgi:hypothetical protein
MGLPIVVRMIGELHIHFSHPEDRVFAKINFSEVILNNNNERRQL